MRPHLALSFALLASLPALAADSGDVYRFGTHEKHTNVTFTSEADIENIYGMTHVASGSATLDLAGGKGSASITIPVKELRTGIDKRDEHLRSDAWLDEEKFPSITFEAASFDVSAKNREKGLYEATVKGTLTIHGVAKELTTTAKIAAVPEKAAKVLGDGKWVRVTTAFDVRLGDFGIKIPDGPVKGKVSETWAIKFDCYAGTEK